MSKLRYGLQLCNQVRTKPEDPTSCNMKAAQIAQNKMLRMLDGVSLKDHVSASSLLNKYNLPSVNQLAGEIKLIEAWKSLNIISYPFQMVANISNKSDTDRVLRPMSIKNWNDFAKTKAASESIGIECAKLWNNAPQDIKSAPTMGIAKSAIKKYCKTFEL